MKGLASWRLLAAVALTTLLVACGGSGKSDTESAERPSSTGRVTILAPQPGQSVSATDATVRLELTGARIIPQASTNLRPDEGHIHLKLDGKIITLLGTLEEKLPPLSPGPHLLEVEFVAADHSPFNPRVIETVTFNAQ